MEFFLTILIFSAISVVFNLVINFFNKYAKSLQFRLEEENIPDSDMKAIFIKAKGLIPIKGESVQIVTIVEDITDEKPQPVLCFLPEFQNKKMYFFHQTFPLPYDNTEITQWMKVGMFLPEVCILPKSKERKLNIHLILSDSKGNNIKKYSLEKDYYNHKRGYLEIEEHKIDLFKLELKILMKIAMSDQELHVSERELLYNKINAFLSSFEEERHQLQKDFYNILSEEFNNSENLSQLLEKFKELSTDSENYNLIKSCADIMGADGKIEKNEIQLIDEISHHLKLDFKKVNELKDFHVLKTDIFKSESAEKMLGIQPEWSYEHIQEHLKKQFIKWNSRIQDCSDDKERERVQKMLDLTIEFIDKYKDVKKAE